MHLGTDSLWFIDAPFGDTLVGYLHISNQGPTDLTVSLSPSSSDFVFLNSPNTTIPPDSQRTWQIGLIPSGIIPSYNETIQYQTTPTRTMQMER